MPATVRGKENQKQKRKCTALTILANSKKKRRTFGTDAFRCKVLCGCARKTIAAGPPSVGDNTAPFHSYMHVERIEKKKGNVGE